jgi:phosphatidylserine/phosphatidylglycerophosphate/cardiolipin synthase-like enzyme
MTAIPPAGVASYPRRDGNRVHPLVDGEPAFRRICQAVEAARRRVWVTVAFLDHDVQMPDGRGSVFDVLDRAAARGVDVRMLFWREPELPRLAPDSSHFAGTDDERAELHARGARFRARWDHLPRYCHHQKSWVIDAGEPGELAFVGGINLDRASVVPPGHPPRADKPSVHDVYLELAGPASSDVAHNFVQRWNQASDRDRADGCWPDRTAADDLPFPARLAAVAGDAPVQITRTVRAGRYTSEVPAPGAASFPIAAGEASVLEQYLTAIDAAREGIYVENQFLASVPVLARLAAAVQRGVEVVVVLPGIPMPAVRAARAEPRAAPFFDALAALGMRPNFTLAALATPDRAGRRHEVYVHAKIMLIDDAWATIGSTNILTRSFHADTELNASVWHPPTVRALRETLLREHTGIDTGAMDLPAALQAFVESAAVHRDRHARGLEVTGLAYAIDPSRYGA